MNLFGKYPETLAKPSHEGGADQRSGKQGTSLFGKKQDRLAPPANVSGGKAKKQPNYRPPESL